MGVGEKASSSGHSFAEVVRATASSAADSGELKTLPLGFFQWRIVLSGRMEVRI